MAVFKTEIHLWTLRNQLLISETGLGFFSYHDKAEKDLYTGVLGSSYAEEKQAFVEGHGVTWAPPNNRPLKLRDQIKDLEETLNNAANIFCCWQRTDLVQIILPSGVIFWLSVDQEHGDITRVIKDSSLSGKLSLTSISDVVSTSSVLAFCSSDKCKLEIVQFTKGALENQPKKLSSLEPKITQIDLPGRPGRSLSRKMQICASGDALLIYWPIASEEAWPWAPMSNDLERANLSIVSLLSSKPSVVAFSRTESDPIIIEFSVKSSSKLLSIERNLSSKSYRAEVCTYELTKSSIRRTFITYIQTGSSISFAAWDNSQRNLLLVCDDNTLVLYSESLKVPLVTTASFRADHICWHPSDSFMFIMDNKGDIQAYDKALNNLELTMEGIEYVPQLKLSAFFRLSPLLKRVSWCNQISLGQGCQTINSLLISFDRGPLAFMKVMVGSDRNRNLCCSTLVSEYLKSNSLSQASKLLTSMSWEVDSGEVFQCMVNIVNELLRKPLDKHTEGLLETALGCFYAPQEPLSDIIILEYRNHICNLARRFFHHLVRYSRFDKAFLLAIDINARDLFMDIYYAALDKGCTALASAARQRASLCEEDLVFSDSDSSVNDHMYAESESFSGSSDDSVISPHHAEALVRAHVNGLPPPLPPRKPPRQQVSTPPVPPRSHRNGVTYHSEQTPPLPPRSRHRSTEGAAELAQQDASTFYEKHSKIPQHQSGGVLAPSKTHIAPDHPGSTPHCLPPKHVHGNPTLSSNGGSTGEALSPQLKYKHVAGCTLPGGYTFDLEPHMSQQILSEFTSMLVDDHMDFRTDSDAHPSKQGTKAVKVIHFGLV